eukprot:3646967-Prymnesium_polylepis.1
MGRGGRWGVRTSCCARAGSSCGSSMKRVTNSGRVTARASRSLSRSSESCRCCSAAACVGWGLG